jgi:hypothetical protein
MLLMDEWQEEIIAGTPSPVAGRGIKDYPKIWFQPRVGSSLRICRQCASVNLMQSFAADYLAIATIRWAL